MFYSKYLIFEQILNFKVFLQFPITININTFSLFVDSQILHTTTYKNNKEITIVLISHGANINEKDKYGNIALHYASICNSKERDELLTSLGSNINEKDIHEKQACHEAFCQSEIKKV